MIKDNTTNNSLFKNYNINNNNIFVKNVVSMLREYVINKKLLKWKNYIDSNLINLLGDKPEGNIYTKHMTVVPNNLMVPKQKNIANLLLNKNFCNNNAKNEKLNVLEIGFNGGFSALLMLLTNEDINFTAVDINEHSYVVPCFNKIKTNYNNISLILESSETALDKLIEQNLKYDIIHIDGDHNLPGATRDMEKCIKLSKSGTIIIFDDTNLNCLNKLCDKYVELSILKNYDNLFFTECTTYKHRFLEKI